MRAKEIRNEGPRYPYHAKCAECATIIYGLDGPVQPHGLILSSMFKDVGYGVPQYHSLVQCPACKRFARLQSSEGNVLFV